MKTNKVTILGRKLAVNLFVLTALAIFAVSCDKDDTDMNPSSPMTQSETPSMSVPPAGSAAPAPGEQSIAQTAIDAGFGELVKALQYVDEELDAGLVDLFLNGTGQYTVFAPNNDAFFALYGVDGEISDLDNPELVLDVLKYHVVEGRRASNSVVPPVRPRDIFTLLGETFSVNSSGVITDIAGQEAAILTPNIPATNGIIHIIDTVLLPLE